MGLSGRYRCQGDTIRNRSFPDTDKPPTSVFCAHFLDKPETLSFSGGVCNIPYLFLIEFTT